MHFLFNYTMVLRFFKVWSFIIFIFLLISCESEKSNSILVSDSGQTQGTYYHIKYMIEDEDVIALLSKEPVAPKVPAVPTLYFIPVADCPCPPVPPIVIPIAGVIL